MRCALAPAPALAVFFFAFNLYRNGNNHARREHQCLGAIHPEQHIVELANDCGENAFLLVMLEAVMIVNVEWFMALVDAEQRAVLDDVQDVVVVLVVNQSAKSKLSESWVVRCGRFLPERYETNEFRESRESAWGTQAFSGTSSETLKELSLVVLRNSKFERFLLTSYSCSRPQCWLWRRVPRPRCSFRRTSPEWLSRWSLRCCSHRIFCRNRFYSAGGVGSIS